MKENEEIGHERKISSFYENCRKEVFAYIRKRYALSTEDLEDLYQESFTAMYENVRNGKYKELPSCSLKTYLFQICINKTLDYVKEKQKREDIDLHRLLPEDNLEDLKRKEQIYSAIARMPSPCKDILFAFYWDKYDMDEIARLMKYKDATVAKTQKSRCMKKVQYLLYRIMNR